MSELDTYPQWVNLGGIGISNEQYSQWRASLGYDTDRIKPAENNASFVLVAVKIMSEEERVLFKLRFGV